MNEHVIQIQGTGHFSRSSCTGCVWAHKGHPDEAQSSWSRYHVDGNVLPLPGRVELPPMAEDETARKIEKRIIQLLAHHIDFGTPALRMQQFVSVGLAEARQMVLGEPVTHAAAYVADMTARVASVSRRQREKLRHPASSRERQQEILEER